MTTIHRILITVLLSIITGLAYAGPDHSCASIDDTHLRIIDKATEYQATLPSGDVVTITRTMTECAKNKGWLQPLVPAPGIIPVTEFEVLEAIGDPEILLVDMRTQEWYLERTIPGAINIPYTEIAMRLTELGCESANGAMDCSNAKSILGFCNGPVCPQSPTAMNAMIREGFPTEKIMYYRGGMLDWDALGLTTVEGDF